MGALTPITATSLAERAKDLLEDAAELTSGVDPNYIRDAQPDSLFEALPLAAARQGCRRYADKGGNYPELRAARAERACRPYLDSLEYGDPPSLVQPFTGGQCSDLRYNVFGTYTSNQEDVGGCGTTRNWQASGIFGPISGITKDPGIQQGWKVQGGITAVNCVDIETGKQLIDVSSCGPSVSNFTVRAGRPSISSVVPLFGEPDVCGDRPPEYTPPTAPALPGPPVERYNPGPNIDVNIGVEVNIDGSIDIDFGTGPITIDPFGDSDEPGGGGDEPGGGGPDGGPVEPGFQGEPGTPIDVGPGDAADETDPNRNLIGVLVQTIQLPARANQVFNETETYTKGGYFVYFGGDGGLALNPEGAITREDQFFYAPKGANRFRVVPNVGFTIRVTPHYERED